MTLQRRVLIVDDDSTWADILASICRSHGFVPFVALSVEGARQLLLQHRYDLAVIDLVLSPAFGDLAGVGVAELLLELGDATQVMILSGALDLSTIDAALKGIWSDRMTFVDKGRFDPVAFVRAIASTTVPNERPGVDVEGCGSLWTDVGVAEGAKARGVALELFAADLLSRVPELTLTNRRFRTASSELDLVFSVKASAGLFSDWGRLLLVECRNKTKPVSAKEIRDFAQKLDNADAKVGLVMSPSGITGTGLRDARAAIAAVFQRPPRRRILSVDAVAINTCLTGGVDLAAMLDGIDREVRLMM